MDRGRRGSEYVCEGEEGKGGGGVWEDLLGITPHLVDPGNEGTILVRPHVHKITCRGTRSQYRHMGHGCHTLPPSPPPPLPPTQLEAVIINTVLFIVGTPSLRVWHGRLHILEKHNDVTMR